MAEQEAVTFNDVDPRMNAAVDLIRRCGAREFQLRYQDDQEPMVWIAMAGFHRNNKGQSAPGKTNTWLCGADVRPDRAVFALCDTVVDGAVCVHCERPTGFELSMDTMPLDALICWYQWDPELNVFRRGCEGSDA